MSDKADHETPPKHVHPILGPPSAPGAVHTLEWQTQLVCQALAMFGSFGLEQQTAILTVLGRPVVDGVVRTFSGEDLLLLLQRTGWGDQHPNLASVDRLVSRLVTESLLARVPSQRYPIPFAFDTFAAHRAVTAPQSSGLLWLAPVLGAPFLAAQIAPAIYCIAGTNPRTGDPAHGSGLALGPHHLLTCKHVVADIDPEVVVGNPQSLDGIDERTVAGKPVMHTHLDVAVVMTNPASTPLRNVPGLVWRDPQWLDPVVVAGYPMVPTARMLPLTLHRGEVTNPSVPLLNGEEMLFTATARPGNSGGPIVGFDGRLLGMVTGSPNRRTTTDGHSANGELGNDGSPLSSPFFAGLPARHVAAALDDLGLDALLVPETWR